jgi:hypothetical protein
MDKWEDYPIKVLGIAPLIIVMLPPVSSFSFGGVLARPRRPPPLVVASFESSDPPCEWSPSSSLSLACWRPLGRMALSLCEWRRLQILRVETSSRLRNGGPNRPRNGPGRPAQAHFSPVQSPLCAFGSSCHYALCPLHLHHFDNVIITSKMQGLLAWSSVFYTSILEDVPLKHFGPFHLWERFHHALEHERDS